MRAKRFFRAVSSVLLVTIGSMTTQPLQAAIQIERAQAKNAPAPKAADEKYGDTLREIEEQSLKAKRNRKAGKSSKAEAKAIRSFVKALDALEGDVEAGFAATERHLRDKKLAQVIFDRHNAAVATYRQKRDEFKALMKAVDSADSNASDIEIDSALTSLSDFFEKHSQIRKSAKLDPNKLPWRTPEVTKRLPVTDPKGFKTARFGYEPTHVAGVIPAGTAMPKALSAKPTPEDLAETEDAQITPAILAKAQELGNDPLKIYSWVRNNVRFIPTYGSIQGSQDTLDKLSGNAFDTASLLIALLRAANVPARYAYGTIDVPVDQAMNWVGGVTKVEAAQQVLGQGGIPNAPVISGGVVRHIRMEHVWVEAWIDYLPSRGAQHIEGDTWIPVDASYKQYEFSSGVNLQAAVPFDTNSFLTGAAQGATQNASEGWVQNLNQANIQLSFADYRNRLKTYLEAQMPEATLGDVLGKQVIVVQNLSTLPGSLQHRVVAKGPKFAALPVALRHQFEYHLYAHAFERTVDNPTWSFRQSLPQLAGKKLTISFKPSTKADADLIASYLPQPPADGSPIDPRDFPSSLPSYARVTSELRVDGVVVASGGTFNLGTELAGLGGFTQHDFSGWDLTPDDTHVAGQASALGLNVQGISLKQLLPVRAELESAMAKFLEGNVAGLTAERLTGNVLTATVWTYFRSVNTHGLLAQRHARVIDIPSFSYGFAHVVTQPNKLFGVITTSIKFAGLMMDVGHLRHLRVAKDNDAKTTLAYNRLRGQMASALEHATPEHLFVDATTCNLPDVLNPDPEKPPCPQGISAIKGIAAAQAAGQKAYTITHENQSAIESLQLSAETKDDIANAVAAGKEVTVHERPISSDGWTGAAYVISDPSTGAGAYLIEGKANGGRFLGLLLGVLLGMAAVMLALTPLGWIAGGAGFLASLIFSMTNDTDEVIDFKSAKLIGVLAGIVLAVILFQFVVVSFTFLFAMGLIALSAQVVALLVREIYRALR